MDYDRLGEEVARSEYAELDAQAVADALNARNLPVVVDVPTFDARGLLLGTGEWGALCIFAVPQPGDAQEILQARAVAITARDTLTLTQSLETSKPAYMGAVTQMLGLLTQVGVISAGTRDALLALTQSSRSRADELAIGPVTDQDVLTVRKMAQMAEGAS